MQNVGGSVDVLAKHQFVFRNLSATGQIQQVCRYRSQAGRRRTIRDILETCGAGRYGIDRKDSGWFFTEYLNIY